MATGVGIARAVAKPSLVALWTCAWRRAQGGCRQIPRVAAHGATAARYPSVSPSTVVTQHMLQSQLADLDELVLTVRDPRSRTYIAEAVVAYRAGARRAALIATWIAVAFDIIAKLRELAASGDGAARDFVSDLDRAIEARVPRPLQEIENGLIESAQAKFALLAPHEADALKRLKEDRNLCAHPAFVEEDRLFEPAPEAVRAHIVHAVTFLLQHQPVQGKHAIEKVLEELERLSFPAAPDDAASYLDARYLLRAKGSLITNLTKRLLLVLLRRDVAGLVGRERALEHALAALDRRSPVLYREALQGTLGRVVSTLNDSELKNVCSLVGADPRTWGWLGDALQLRVRQFVATYDFCDEHVAEVLRASTVDDLRMPILDAFESLERTRQIAVIAESPIAPLIPAALQLFGSAGGWRSAESIGSQLIVPLAPLMSGDHLETLLSSAESNAQIWDASEMPRILAKVVAAAPTPSGASAEAWKSFMVAMSRGNRSHDPYAVLRAALKDRGVDVPMPARLADDDDD